MEKQAVLLMSYGTPNRTEEIWDGSVAKFKNQIQGL